MSANDLLTVITQGSLLLIAVLTLVDLVRFRDQARLDIALMFGALAAIVLLQGLTTVLRRQVPWMGQLGAVLLLAQPYLLLRLVQHFGRVPRTIQVLALGGMVLCWVGLILVPAPLPKPLTLVIVVYFVFVEGYAAVAFVRGAVRTGGVTRPRLGLAAAGSGLLALVILLAGFNQVLPGNTGLTTPLSQLLALLSMVSYYLGFAPPRPLHQTWQLVEVQRFLRAAAGRRVTDRVTTTLDQLCVTATRAVGGIAAVVVLWDATSQRLMLRASSGLPVLADSLTLSDGAIRRAWHQRKPTVAYTVADFGSDVTPLATAAEAGALLVVPLATAERAWGLLLVFCTRSPLFVIDDLNLLTLLTEQSAIALDYAALLDDQQALVGQLRLRSAQLERANQALEHANRAKDRFLANMSHELRTPLNAIIGFSEILIDQTFGDLNAKQIRYVTNILTSGRHLLQLINDILDLAKVEAGRLELLLERFDVATALHDVQTIVKTLAHKKRIQLTIDVEPDLPLLSADQPKFKQILYNLLSNAIKFTPDGGSVRVTAGMPADHALHLGSHPTEVANASFLRVCVSDTGIGIKPEDYERVFGEFEQIDSSYARQQEGTGLGLALTRKLVELHGGRIWVESEGAVGHGSIFTFVVPFDPETVEAGEAAEREEAHDGTQGAKVDQLVVLVVEDDPQSSELLTLYLTSAGYAVLHAFDGTEALHTVWTAQPDVIVLDILLQKKDGLAVLAELKTMPETRDIPVIIVSITENQTVAFSLGAFDYFVKPIDKVQLIEAVQLAQGRVQRALTVLVVDDEPHVIELVTDVLQMEGHHVLHASSGRQAIAMAGAQHPDLIVLDLMMPGVTGFEVIQHLRDRPDTCTIPILVYTAKNLTEAERRVLDHRVRGVASKAGGKEALLRQINRLKQQNSKP